MASTPVSDQNSEKVFQVEVPQQEQPNFNSAAKKNEVGFNCEFVERPPKAFQVDCPVCLLVLREPHQLTCCGYSFCQPCIDRVGKDKKPCPTCNKAEFSVFPNKGLQHSIYQYQVLCGHRQLGCQWVGELGELDKHLNENPILGRQFVGCEFAEVECNDCHKSFQRQHFKAHQLEQHPFSCEYCHDYESYYEDVVKNHYPICGSRPVPCPNECEVYPERQNLEHHVSNECSLVEVNCDFNYAGCEVKLLRKDMPAHLAENVMLHKSQQATYNQKKVQEKDQQIMQLTEDLRKELEVNRQKIDQLKGENETLSKSLLEKKEEIAQLKHDLCVKEEALKQEIAQLREDACAKEEILKQAITELRQKQDNAVTEEEAQKKDEALQHEIATVKREIAELQQERRESENKLKTTEEEAQKKNETLQHEIAELREKSASKEENDTLSKSLLKLQEDVRVKEEATRHTNELLKQEIAQLRQKQDDATSGIHMRYKEIDTLKEESTQLQEHMHKKDEAMRQEIVDLKQELQESENKLKTTEEEAQKKNETLQHEIAELREKSASKEENDTLSKSLLKLQEDVRVKEEATRHTNELLKQEIAQLRQKQDDATSGIHMRYKEIDTLKEESTQLQEHMHKKDEAMRQEIVDLKQELQESENKLKTTEEEAQKKNETLQHEIAELREKSASKEENDTLSKSLLKLQEDVRVKEEATRHTNELLKQEIAQLRQKQDDATSGIHMRYKEIDTLKEESTQLQEHMHKKDEAMRQEIVDLKQELQESENKLKTTEKEAQKKDETLQHEIAALKRRQEDAVSKEESEAIKQEIAELRERIEKNEAVKQEVIQVGKKQEETVSKEDYETTKQELTQLKAKQEEDWSSLQSYTGPPIDRIMTEFEKHNQDDDEWYSEPFYTHPYGYKMCLNVNANGAEPGKGKHISVFCYLMRGKFDDRLRWPFQGHITVQLINHLEDKEHYTATLDFSNADSDLANRVVTSERARNGKGTIKFIPHNELGYDRAKNCQYLKDDCLRFRVTRVTNLNWTSLERQCLVMESRVCVPPFEFTMRDFKQQKTDNDIWYSPSFYTHERGYRMCVRVHVNGDDAAKGEHVSVFIHLMRGEWDNYLKWPFRGGITIQLLNQTEDKEHCENICEYSDTVADAIAGRVTTTERAQEFGWLRFISHDALNYDKTKNCQYLKYDSLQFRIANVEPKK